MTRYHGRAPSRDVRLLGDPVATQLELLDERTWPDRDAPWPSAIFDIDRGPVTRAARNTSMDVLNPIDDQQAQTPAVTPA